MLRRLRAGVGPRQRAALDAAVSAALPGGLGRAAAEALRVRLQEGWLSRQLGARWPTPAGWVATPAPAELP
jgi:hypothetical protein